MLRKWGFDLLTHLHESSECFKEFRILGVGIQGKGSSLFFLLFFCFSFRFMFMFYIVSSNWGSNCTIYCGSNCTIYWGSNWGIFVTNYWCNSKLDKLILCRLMFPAPNGFDVPRLFENAPRFRYGLLIPYSSHQTDFCV